MITTIICSIEEGLVTNAQLIPRCDVRITRVRTPCVMWIQY